MMTGVRGTFLKKDQEKQKMSGVNATCISTPSIGKEKNP